MRKTARARVMEARRAETLRGSVLHYSPAEGTRHLSKVPNFRPESARADFLNFATPPFAGRAFYSLVPKPVPEVGGSLLATVGRAGPVA